MPRISTRPWALLVMLIGGIALAWFSKQQFDLSAWRIAAVIVIAIACGMPPVRRGIAEKLDRLREPTPRQRFSIALLFGAVATIYLLATAFGHHREVFPKCHDENSYVIQARIMAMGRLWLPMHPLGDFFESFHMITKPVYAPIYFPGTALMNVPMAWLSLPEFVIPMLLSGAIVGLTYRIVTELVDGVGGLLAALLVISPYWFRTNSTLVMSQSPAMLLGLLLVWAWLRWRVSPTWKWSLAIGIFAGWAAVTRPVDALAFAIPVGVAMFVQLLRSPAKKWLTTAGPVLAGAIPLLSLQLLLNYGTTGNALQSPYVDYLKESQPATSYGYHPYDPSAAPTSPLLQKHAYYYQFLRGSIELHRVDRIWTDLGWRLQRTADVVVAWRVFLILVPVALLGLTRRDRLVFAATIPLFVGLYVPNTYYLEHYIIPLIAPTAMLIVLGIDVIRRSDLPGELRRALTVFATISVAVLSIVALPEFKPKTDYRDDTHYPEREVVNMIVKSDIQKPALLLIHFDIQPDGRGGLKANPHDEPVYNTGVAWPDDADVVRAHDFGPERRLEVLDYYAKIQPERNVYLYDRPSRMLYKDLGTVATYRETLRKQLDADPAATRSASLSQPTTAPIIP